MEPQSLERQLLAERLARIEETMWRHYGRSLTEEERARYWQQDGDLSPLPKTEVPPVPTERQMREWVDVVIAYPEEVQDALAPLLDVIVTRALERRAHEQPKTDLRIFPVGKSGTADGDEERASG